MTAPTKEELSQNFVPEQWAKRRPAYASGGPLQIPLDAAKTLGEAFLRRAKDERNGVTYIRQDGEEDFQSYATLLREAKCILHGLRKLRLAPGSRVILQIESLRQHFTTFWACVLGGFTPVTVAVAPSYTEKNGIVSKLYNTWRLLKAPIIITSAYLEKRIRELAAFLSTEGLDTVAVESLQRNGPEGEIYPSKPEDVVFFQLTSGSTGIPKCIPETHRAIIAHIHGAQQFNGYTAQDVTLNWLPVDHVVPILTSHLKDVYLGCRQIHVKSEVVLSDSLRWLDLIHQHRVTHTWSPNFGFKLVADRLVQNPARTWDLSCIKFVMNAGEQVTLPVLRDFLQKTAPYGIVPTMMQPAFGMAEVCTCMTYQNRFDLTIGVHRFRKSSLGGLLENADDGDRAAVTFVDLGPPVPGVEIRITDRKNRVLPEGVIGRFQIRGDVVTPGYLDNDAANKEAFVGNGWFNSGDLGFILNGRLTLTGREKEMIIVRGANFYCYEIEDMVNEIEGVEPTFVSSCAVADENTGTESLAIMFVPTEGHNAEKVLEVTRQIKTKVAASLGVNPSFVIPLEKRQFLKTTSGKIQRSQMKNNFEAGEYDPILQRLEIAAENRAKQQARDALEEKLICIWQELLPVKKLGIADNFFEIGGDSLLAARVVSRVQDAFRVSLPLHVLFNGGGTVAGMAEHIRTAAADAVPLPPVVRRQRPGPVPASHSQQRLWLLDQITPGCPAYHVGAIIRFEGPLDVAALEKAISALVQRHESLRTQLQVVDGVLCQLVSSHPMLSLELRDSSHIASDQRDSALRRAVMLDAKKPFDLAEGKLIRAVLYKNSAQDHSLLLALHQVATDGWSMGILFNELKDFYGHFAHGTALDLPAIPVRYTDFAQWQREWLQGDIFEKQMNYWRKELAPPLPLLNLPTDLPRPRIQTFASRAERHSLPPDLAEQVRTFAREHNSTVFMILLSAWQGLLSRITGQPEVIVGTAMSARSKPELEKLVGFFVNTVALRANLTTNPSFLELVSQTRDKTLNAFTNQHAPFEKLVEELQPSRALERPPIFQVWFGSWDPLPRFESSLTRITVEELFTAGAQFDIALFVIDAPNDLSILWEHNTDLFCDDTIARLRKQYEAVLRLVLDHPNTRLQTIFAKLSESEMQWDLEEQRSLRSNLRAARRRPVEVVGETVEQANR